MAVRDPVRRALIIGAGISGLAAARALQKRSYETRVLEACPSVGGLTRTARAGEFCFDYTGHLLHLSRYGSPSGVPYAGLRDDDWQQIDRRSFCFVGGRLITAPIQYHLAELPSELLRDCAASYEARPPHLPESRAVSFRDFIVSGFGQALADVFLIPQNEKTMATSLDRLSTDAVKRFFPPPDDRLVRAGMTSGAPSPTQYNSQFWYPKHGGIEALVDGLARGLESISTLEEVVAVDLATRTARSRNGKTWTWDIMLPSMPLRTLCAITTDNDLREWARELGHSSTISINLGIRGALAPELSTAHWIYVPDRSVPFYRVGFYSNISRGMCPPSCASLYVEVGVPGEDLAGVNIVGDLQPRVLQALSDLGWLRVDSVVCSLVHVMRCAYVWHTPGRERVFELIMSRLAEHGVFPIGRYGLWDYTSMEDSIHSAISTVERVA